ncbi:MAG: RNA methyltransferase [Anaerovibrio sp.]|uniref:TrmH family RNA methyltransferase n=1 Tax=Anaerovibrio sp. TaxID=1872532 RepID=UPI0025CDBFCD|nr:RNA methyltransferase [Anaerovibrio sp.]MCR5175707.1 RNA methyltransferase [Anaerovibrio sp.]
MLAIERIESTSNSKIKLAAKLHSPKHRKAENMFVAEGVRLAEMAARSEWPVEFALISDSAVNNPRAVAIVEVLQEKGCPVYQVSDQLYGKAADTVTPQGLLLVMSLRIFTWQEMLKVNEEETVAPLIVVLDGVQDPGNAGNIIRTAEALGCSGIVCLEGTTDIFADKVVRSSMGSLFNIPVMTGVSPYELLDVCHENEVPLIATAVDDTAVRHYLADYVSPCAIIFGNEGNGVSAQLLHEVDQKVYIPMSGKAESLNVSAAVAILLYEAFRQRSIL